MLVLIGFGIWMGLNSPEWSFDQHWIQLALGLLP
jgi:hypothetical protein